MNHASANSYNLTVPEAECEEGFISREAMRLRAENQRRNQESDSIRYAPWEPAEILMRAERKYRAAIMLRQAGVFPHVDSQCLEVGYGSLGWLADLISWGVRETSLHGIELDSTRAERAQQRLPSADLRIGNATELPWTRDTFDLVIVSTVFTSILDRNVRKLVAQEIIRVIKPGGAVLWYDFKVNNPRNPHVSKVSRRELDQLFAGLAVNTRSVTLAPPLARIIASKSWALANVLGAVPILRTHLLGVLVKPPTPVALRPRTRGMSSAQSVPAT